MNFKKLGIKAFSSKTIVLVFLSFFLNNTVQARFTTPQDFFSVQNDTYFSTNTEADIPCMDGQKVLHIMNETALQWKANKKSGYKTRALINGFVDFLYPDKTGHRHFSMNIGSRTEDKIEVIYNQSFGSMPNPKLGDKVEACGDFIVATKQNGNYPPSPDGAIIHWVHKSPKKSHDHGYVILNDVLYGFGNSN